MKEAAFYPITSVLQLAEHAPYVHNAVYMTQYQNFDPANVWLSKPGAANRSSSLAGLPFSRGRRRGYIQAKLPAQPATTRRAARAGDGTKGELRGPA